VVLVLEVCVFMEIGGASMSVWLSFVPVYILEYSCELVEYQFSVPFEL
jgi:hypothetical protein